MTKKLEKIRIPNFQCPLWEVWDLNIISREEIIKYAEEYNIFESDLYDFLKGIECRINNADNPGLNSVLGAMIICGYKPLFLTSMKALYGGEEEEGYVSVNIPDKINGFDGYSRTLGLLCFKSTGDYNLDINLKKIVNEISQNLVIKVQCSRD
jgi:hypothetical protein